MDIKINKIIAVAFLLVLTLNNLSAFGITPGRTTITYNNIDREFFFTVINSDAEDIDLRFTTSGDLGDYIVLDETSSSMRADEKYRLFRFTLNIDDEFKIPGNYEGKINIEKVAKQGEGFGIGLSLNSQVVLKVTETTILLREDVFSKDEELSVKDISKFNGIILVVLLIVLILVLSNKVIRVKKRSL